MGGKFKFHVQDSDLGYVFWRFDKHIALSKKKLPLCKPLQHILFQGTTKPPCTIAFSLFHFLLGETDRSTYSE